MADKLAVTQYHCCPGNGDLEVCFRYCWRKLPTPVPPWKEKCAVNTWEADGPQLTVLSACMSTTRLARFCCPKATCSCRGQPAKAAFYDMTHTHTHLHYPHSADMTQRYIVDLSCSTSVGMWVGKTWWDRHFNNWLNFMPYICRVGTNTDNKNWVDRLSGTSNLRRCLNLTPAASFVPLASLFFLCVFCFSHWICQPQQLSLQS